MPTSNIQVTPANRKSHLLSIAQLASDAFSAGQYVEQYAQNYIGNSHYDWHVTRLVMDGEKLIHHWGVWGYQMRLESIQLKIAGIGAVVTHPDYREQGWMHRAAQASFDAMLQDGYDLSILRGRHYVKMGYARAWNYVTYRLKPEELPKAELLQPYQPLGVDQTPAMDALYNRTYAGFTGTALRPTYRNRFIEDMGVYAWFNGQGELAGYVRAFPDRENPKILQCLEAAGDPQQGFAVLRDMFNNGEYESLAFFTLHHQHPMLQQLRKGACIVEHRYFSITGWRVRLVNLHSTLQKLVPLLEARLVGSQFKDWQGSLRLDAGEQKASLHIAHGKVEITSDGATSNVLRGGAALARLLIGSDEAEEVIHQAGMETTGLAVPLVRVLFPNLYPMMSNWDEY